VNETLETAITILAIIWSGVGIVAIVALGKYNAKP